ncbi:MAG TPA: thiamine pyrophosphate-binding protein, partial [Gemmatimonadales bacterium]|nr:thiamine pyrophosphate-binding protein [Gemmatimonadales bacterium]
MKVTAAHALVEGLIAEGVECVLGILGHGNVQLGQAIAEARGRIRYVPVKNEQAAVHAAIAWARQRGTPLAVTTSVGPGATNLVTGAACARINRLPVLLLPGEVSSDGVGPLLQQLETLNGTTVNDTLKPVSKYWARLTRPEHLRRVLREAFDAMLEPGNEGPATICLPMDVQATAADFDERWLRTPVDRRPQRATAGAESIREAADVLLRAERPFLISGGGVIRSGAQAQLRALAEALQIPVAHTQAGKGALAWEHPLNVYGVGPTGSRVANSLARRADVILGVGTRYADFTTASETAFRADARFINVNICWTDVGKERALKLWGD